MAGTDGTSLLTAMPGLIKSGSSIAGAYSSSSAIRSRGAYEKQQYETNSALADLQASDALERGQTTVGNIQKRTEQTVGAERASMGAGGVDVNSGSAADVQANTRALGALDALTAKNNAWKEAFGFKVDASNSRGKAAMAELAANNESNNTLLTGGMNALAFGSEGLSKLYSSKMKVPATGSNPYRGANTDTTIDVSGIS